MWYRTTVIQRGSTGIVLKNTLVSVDLPSTIKGFTSPSSAIKRRWQNSNIFIPACLIVKFWLNENSDSGGRTGEKEEGLRIFTTS